MQKVNSTNVTLDFFPTHKANANKPRELYFANNRNIKFINGTIKLI